MKKKGVNVNIHLTNRVMYSLISLALILIVAIGVYAFGGSDPSYVGHSAGELDGLGALATKDTVDWSEITDKPMGLSEDLPTCTGTQKLTFNGTDVVCAEDIDNILSKGARVYIQHSKCVAPGALTTSSTCQTRRDCDDGDGNIGYHKCSFSFSCGFRADTCNNNPAGYIVS